MEVCIIPPTHSVLVSVYLPWSNLLYDHWLTIYSIACIVTITLLCRPLSRTCSFGSLQYFDLEHCNVTIPHQPLTLCVGINTVKAYYFYNLFCAAIISCMAKYHHQRTSYDQYWILNIELTTCSKSMSIERFSVSLHGSIFVLISSLNEYDLHL